MELKDFVAQAIIQVTLGVKESQEQLAGEWVRVNPKPQDGAQVAGQMLYIAENGAAVFPLTFDVAVSAEEKQGNHGMGITVLGIGGINLKNGSTESRSTVSRVSFTIPVAYPLKNISGKA